MIRLLELRDGTVRGVLPAGRDLAGWHQALTSEIAAHLTPAHAALLATPVRGETGTAWFVSGTAMRRFVELDAADRDRLSAAAGAILSDIRRLAQSGAAPAVATAWPALRTVPDLNHLFAVDGRPVLAGWGFAAPTGGAGPLAALDDGIVWPQPPRSAWPVYWATLAGLAVLALLVGLVLVPLGALFMPSPAVCRVAPGQLALLLEQSREAARADGLKAQLAQLQEARGEQALQCPIPREVVPPPAPPPHADLPQERWDRHDLAMMQGCWNNYTRMSLRETATSRVKPVRTWVFCFDGHGHGHQTITLENGERCENNLTASFDRDNSLRMLDDGNCALPSGPLVRGQLTCRRASDTDATCARRDLEGAARGRDQTGGFRRADATVPAAAENGTGPK